MKRKSSVTLLACLLSKTRLPGSWCCRKGLASCVLTQVRTYCTGAEKKSDGVKTARRSSKVLEYVREVNPKFLDVCPDKYLKIVSKVDSLCMTAEDAAKEFVRLIIDDLSKNTSFVAEMNPGFGVLTKELLAADVPVVHIYEEECKFHDLLRELGQQFPHRLDLRVANITKLMKYVSVDNYTNGRLINDILMGVEERGWEEKACIQLVGVLSEYRFINYLIKSTVFQNSIMANGRIECYLAVLPSIWKRYTYPNSEYTRYTANGVLFEILFNYKLYGTINRKSCIPWQANPTKKTQPFKKEDHVALYVVKIEPKADLFTRYLRKQDLIPFWYFVHHHMVSKQKCVIPELEKWISDCGVKLIAKDYNIFTQFGDLTPQQFLELFKEFQSWPEYRNSNFLSSLNSYFKSVDISVYINSNDTDTKNENRT